MRSLLLLLLLSGCAYNGDPGNPYLTNLGVKQYNTKGSPVTVLPFPYPPLSPARSIFIQ